MAYVSHNSSVTMPPFPRPIQYPYTTPITQRPIPPFPPLHGAHPSYSSTASPLPFSHHQQHGLVTNLESPQAPSTLTSPVNLDIKGTPVPLSVISSLKHLDDRRDSITALTLPPLTCAESTLHILVSDGEKTQNFHVHRALLCFYSPYFRELLKRTCRESRPSAKVETKFVTAKIKQRNLGFEWRWEDAKDVEEAMKLPTGNEEVEVQVAIKLPGPPLPPITFQEIVLDTEALGDVGRVVFAAFIDWLYHGYVGFGLTPGQSRSRCDQVTLIRLWVFAGRLGVSECQNACVEGIEWWRATSNIVQTSMLPWVYDNTKDWDGRPVIPTALDSARSVNSPVATDKGNQAVGHRSQHSTGSSVSNPGKSAQSCPLRKLLIDQCAWKLEAAWLRGRHKGQKNEEQFPREALVDLVVRLQVALLQDLPPPFENPEMRKREYWVDFEERVPTPAPESTQDGEMAERGEEVVRGLGIES